MISPSSAHVEAAIARGRVALSAVVLATAWFAPSASGPPPPGWLGGNTAPLAVLSLCLAYSMIVPIALLRGLPRLEIVVHASLWTDLALGALIVVVAADAVSPPYVYLLFAVLAAGVRFEFRRVWPLLGLAVVLYGALAAAAPGAPAPIRSLLAFATTGALLIYLGQQRVNVEAERYAIATADQRRHIARDLHDGWAQALAGINLRIETCRELVRRGRAAEAREHLGDLQASVNREYDDLRAYMRSLAGLPPSEAPDPLHTPLWCSVNVEVAGSSHLVDHVLQILREGISNVLRHAHARSAIFRARVQDGQVMITLDDDGVGFRNRQQRPWSIDSRVRELQGDLQVARQSGPGAHLTITLPQR